MRRSDREVKDLKDIIAIMRKCDVCRVALNQDGYPYILPLNFGLSVKEDKMELYFHGAMDGTKFDLMEKDNRASFEMDCEHKLVSEVERGDCTMEYQSVIGQGRMEMVPDEETYDALCILMRHYHPDYQGDIPLNEAVMQRTRIFKLVVERVTGKIKQKKPWKKD